MIFPQTPLLSFFLRNINHIVIWVREFFHVKCLFECSLCFLSKILQQLSWIEHVIFNVRISNFLHFGFPKGTKVKVLINYTGHWRTILGSRVISAGVGRALGWSSWLRIISSVSSVFYSVRTFFLSNVASLSILLNSFLIPFTFHAYSGWSLAIL